MEVLGRGIGRFHQGRTISIPSAVLTKIKGGFGKENPPSQSLLGPEEWQVHGKITLLLLYSHTWDLSQEFLEDFFRQAQGAGRGITSPRVGLSPGEELTLPIILNFRPRRSHRAWGAAAELQVGTTQRRKELWAL